MNDHQRVAPRRFLFTLWEGGGNVPPQVELARRLVARGHAVRVMSDQCNAAEIQAAGCTFVPYTRAPNRHDKSAASTLLRDYAASNPLQAFLMFRDQIMLGPALAYAHDVLEELQREPADALVINDGLFGPMIAAEKAGLPHAIVLPHHYLYPAPGMPPTGQMTTPAKNLFERMRDRVLNRVLLLAFDSGLAHFNAARAAIGLPPLRHLFDQMDRADRVLVLTSPAFDFSATQLPDNVRYAGPILNDPVWAGGAADRAAAGDGADPLVVVSFSTTFQNQQRVVQKVIDALAGLRVRGLVTTGPSLDPGQLRVPSNVTLQRFARHSELFAHAAAVVTHAGHGTVIRALAHGVPLVCLPMGRDQGGNAIRVAARNAGKALSVKAPVARIRAAIKDVVETPLYREQAQRLALQISNDARSSTAVTELEGVARRVSSSTPLSDENGAEATRSEHQGIPAGLQQST